MKGRRPACHVRAKWISLTLPDKVMFFELDRKGNLISEVANPHHIEVKSTPEPHVSPTFLYIHLPHLPLALETPVITDPEFFECDTDFDPDFYGPF
jgi:hypothetical protein